MLAHRFAYEHYVGPIPEGMEVAHLCDTPACVNPDHLRLATHAENMQQMAERGRSARAKLTPDQVRAIRAREDTIFAMAIAFGVTPTTISNVLARRTYKHVT